MIEYLPKHKQNYVLIMQILHLSIICLRLSPFLERTTSVQPTNLVKRPISLTTIYRYF